MVFVCRSQLSMDKPRPKIDIKPHSAPTRRRTPHNNNNNNNEHYATLCYHPPYPHHLPLDDKASLYVFPPTPDTSHCKLASIAEEVAASEKRNNKKPRRIIKRSKSSELRGGAFYVGCDCEKRNGLQDNCPRSACQGSPECLRRPRPICAPSSVSYGRHLGTNYYGPAISGKPHSDEGRRMVVKYDEVSVTQAANDRGFFITYQNYK